MESTRRGPLPTNFVSLQMLQQMRLRELELENKEKVEEEEKGRRLREEERRMIGEGDEDLKKPQSEKSIGEVDEPMKQKLSEKKKGRRKQWKKKKSQSKAAAAGEKPAVVNPGDEEIVVKIGGLSLNPNSGGDGRRGRGNRGGGSFGYGDKRGIRGENPNLIWMKKAGSNI